MMGTRRVAGARSPQALRKSLNAHAVASIMKMVKKKRTGFFGRFKTSRYADEDGSTLTKQNGKNLRLLIYLGSFFCEPFKK